MPRKSFDASVLGEFFWNSTDLLSILAATARGKIVNAAWPEHMGWSLEDLQSSPFIDLFTRMTSRRPCASSDRMVAAPDATLIEFRNRQRHRDGTYR